MNRRVIGALLVVLGLAAGCRDKNHVPSGVLPREKMEGVLWDMIQADQYSSFLTKDSAHIDLKLERLRLYEQIFLLHGVSRDQFRKSYEYYMAHPDLTQTLFDSLQSKGTRLRSEAYSHPSENPVVVTPPATPAPPITVPGRPGSQPGRPAPHQGGKGPAQ